jgi:hypothetical protein
MPVTLLSEKRTFKSHFQGSSWWSGYVMYCFEETLQKLLTRKLKEKNDKRCFRGTNLRTKLEIMEKELKIL